MPLRDFVCESCQTTQERYFTTQAGPPACTCGGALTLLPLTASHHGTTGVFPFTSTHIDGRGTPICVESISHLRQIEKQYGVALTAFSQNASNMNDGMRDLPTHRVGGREGRR